MSHFTPNPALDLVLERTIPMPPERVWAGTWASPKDGELPSTNWSHS